MGTGEDTPPSTSHWLFTCTGANTPGIAIDARMGSLTGPEACKTSSPFVMLVDTAQKGRPKSSISISGINSSSFLAMRLPANNPDRGTTGSRSLSMPLASSWRMKDSKSSNVFAARRAPMIAPILVPAIPFTSIPFFSNTSNIPMCAIPRAAPPPRAITTDTLSSFVIVLRL